MRVRLPARDDLKHRNLLLSQEFNETDPRLRAEVKKEVKARWPDYWDKIKNDFKFEILNN